MDSSTKQSGPQQPDLQQSPPPAPSASPTPQTLDTPSKSPAPATNSFHPTAVTIPDSDSKERRVISAATGIDGYAIVKAIASTKMSIVFQARQPGTDQLVALKLIQRGAFVDRESVERFQQEIKTLGRLQPHKNIMPVYHVGRHQDELYYVMPYLPGGSLSQQMVRFQADRKKAVALVEKIARAVHLMHTQQPKILHRDIKPGNILLGPDDEPILADFGLVKLLDDERGLTNTDTRPGTPPYMAPEQTGLVPAGVTERTDVWALGVVLYELLTGKRPFAKSDNEDTTRLFWRIAHEAPPRPRSAKPDLDAGLEAVVLKCLEKAPEDRFTTAAELADDLDRWLRAEKVQTRRMPVRRLLHRNRWTAVVLLVVLAGVAVAIPAWRRNTPEYALDALGAEYAENGAVVLVPEKGVPRWIEPGIPSNKFISGVDSEGLWTIDAPGLALVELLRQAPPDAYRLRAEIRHLKCAAEIHDPFVGIFVGKHAYSEDGTNPIYWCNLVYNDILSADDQAKRVLAGKANPGMPSGNPARLLHQVYADEGVPQIISQSWGWIKAMRFEPARARADKWRVLELELHPRQIVTRFDGQEMEPLSRDFADRGFQKFLAGLQEKLPRYKRLGDVGKLRLSQRGSLGLVVSNGSAAIKNVTLSKLSARE